MSISIKYNKALMMLFLIGLTSIVIYVAKSQSVDAFKYLSVLMLVVISVSTFNLLSENRYQINWNRAVCYLGILFFYPTLHIIVSLFQEFSLKKTIDGLILSAPYYQLPISALALLGWLSRTGMDFGRILEKYVVIITPIVVAFGFLGLFSVSSEKVGSVYNLFNNFFIPVLMLLFFRRGFNMSLFAYMLIGLALYLVGVIGSRSYMLVFMYLLFFALFAGSISEKLMRILVATMALSIIFYLFFNNQSVVDEESFALVRKLDVNSLLDSLSSSIEGGGLVSLFFWEGNSRAQILLDAFEEFSLSDYLFGKGIFGLYESFVVRNTIEIGWAQEMFWFGSFYVGLVFFLMFVSWVNVRRNYHSNNSKIFYFFGSIIIVRMLDGMVFGMPTYDVYNFLFFMALMSNCLKLSKGYHRGFVIDVKSKDFIGQNKLAM